jgi:hypothetical protein
MNSRPPLSQAGIESAAEHLTTAKRPPTRAHGAGAGIDDNMAEVKPEMVRNVAHG